MKKSILIADDEPSARDYLSRLLEGYSDFELVGKMKNGQEVIDFCRTLKPDILLLDIEMPGVDGLTAAKKLSGKLTNTVIVFITAYDQYAIQAFEHAAVGYILKPFDELELRRTLDRAIDQLEVLEKANFNDRMKILWDQMERKANTHLKVFEIKEKGLVNTIQVEDVLYIQSESEYARLITLKKSYLQRLSIKTLEEQLPANFHQIHRSYIINQHHIRSCKYKNGGFEFLMTNGEVIASSRSFKEAINRWLK